MSKSVSPIAARRLRRSHSSFLMSRRTSPGFLPCARSTTSSGKSATRALNSLPGCGSLIWPKLKNVPVSSWRSIIEPTVLGAGSSALVNPALATERPAVQPASVALLMVTVASPPSSRVTVAVMRASSP